MNEPPYLPTGLPTRVRAGVTDTEIQGAILRSCAYERDRLRQAITREEITLPNGRKAVALEQVEMLPEYCTEALGAHYNEPE